MPDNPLDPDEEPFEDLVKRRATLPTPMMTAKGLDPDVDPTQVGTDPSKVEDRRYEQAAGGPGQWLIGSDLRAAGEKMIPPPAGVPSAHAEPTPFAKVLGAGDLDRWEAAQDPRAPGAWLPYGQKPDLPNDTPLAPDEMRDYQKWARSIGRNPDMEEKNYDLRGYWKDFVRGNPDLPPEMQDKVNAIKAKTMKPAGSGHFPDLYKKPNHPTFSDESIYHGSGVMGGLEANEGGHWDEKSKTFTPGATNLQHWSKEQLQNYFRRYEPQYKVNFGQQ